jgi:uncharacterized membrane protein YfcA
VILPPLGYLGYGLALLIGLALGLLGGGGSILTVPVLHYVMGYDVKAAVPMSLVVVGLTSAVGAVAHARHGTLSLRTALAFGPPAIVGALLGSQLGLRVSAALQLIVFAVVMLLAALSMFFGSQRIVALGEAKGLTPHPQRPFPLITLIGGAVGVLTGVVGVGGGFLYVPTLVVLGGLPMKQAIGTSLALIMLSCIAGVAGYRASAVAFDWTSIALFTAIALVGVAIGSRLVRHVSQTQLRRGFAVFLLVMGALVLLRGS